MYPTFNGASEGNLATQLREWDDTGKATDVADPPFDRFVPMMRYIARR